MNSKLNAIMQYAPGGPQAALFARKLQQKTGWDELFCKGAIDEYKRFIYLTSISTSPLTPSNIVDEVWHLHLNFTRCYWDGLCASVLGYRLHHDPAIPEAQSAMNDQYLHTHHMYRKHFNEVPNPQFWPLKSRQKKPARSKTPTAFILLAPPLLAVTVMAADVEAGNSSGWGLLLFLIAPGFLMLRPLLRARRKKRRSKYERAHCGGGVAGSCSTHCDSEPGDSGGAGCGGGGCGGGGCGG